MILAAINLAKVGVLTFFFSVVAMAGSLIDPSGPIPTWCIRTWGRLLVRVCGVRLTIEGLEQAAFAGPCLVMTNHRSHFDTPVLIAAMPTRPYFVAKQELRAIPFLGWSMAAVGMIFLNRKNRSAARASLKEAGRLIREGRHVVMFPEGTRSSKRGQLGPLKKGGFHLALAAGVPIQPVVLLGTERVLPKHSKHIKPKAVTVRFGRPIPIDPDTTIDELMSRVGDAMHALIGER